MPCAVTVGKGLEARLCPGLVQPLCSVRSWAAPWHVRDAAAEGTFVPMEQTPGWL